MSSLVISRGDTSLMLTMTPSSEYLWVDISLFALIYRRVAMSMDPSAGCRQVRSTSRYDPTLFTS